MEKNAITSTSTTITRKNKKRRNKQHQQQHITNPLVKPPHNSITKQTSSPKRTTKECSLLPTAVAYRNTENLYTSKVTHDCATIHKCIPCAYKIGCFDIKQPFPSSAAPQQQQQENENDKIEEDVNHVKKIKDEEFVKKCPNARPETCPRCYNNPTENNTIKGEINGSGGYYKPGMNILTIGDGDLSFSLALAKIICSSSSSSGTRGRLICTSYESKQTLLKIYPSTIQNTIQELESIEGVSICYNVDATNLQNTLPSCILKEFSVSSKARLDRIIWNFPCIAIDNGYDGQKSELEDNIIMVQKFIKDAVPLFLKRGEESGNTGGGGDCNGEIHICHKTKPPFDLWNMQDILLDTSVTKEKKTAMSLESILSDFRYKGRIVFDRCLYPPYVPRKALDYKSFPCHDACVYIFGFTTTTTNKEQEEGGKEDNGTKKEKEENKNSFPPTLPGSSMDTVTKTMTTATPEHESDTNNAYGIIPVTSEMIQRIRDIHLLLSSSSLSFCNDQKKKKKGKRRSGGGSKDYNLVQVNQKRGNNNDNGSGGGDATQGRKKRKKRR